MFKTEFTRRYVLAMVPGAAAAAMLPVVAVETIDTAPATTTATAAKAGRWAVQTYVSAWQRLCDAAWREELQDPIFCKAAQVAKTANPRPADDAHWLAHEAWRNDVRSWWFAARYHYRTPDDVTGAWVTEQRTRDTPHHHQGFVWLWQPDRETTLTEKRATRAYLKRQDAHWTRLAALIETGHFWPLHLDIDRAAVPYARMLRLRAQFEGLRIWATAASSDQSRASWGVPQTPPLVRDS